ncbi:MAG: hypothetical protein ACLP01_08890 [Solirubrobacteraceae bacterium]
MATVVVALVIVSGYLLASQAGGDREASSSVVGTSSSAPLAVGAGPFWYMRTIGTMRAPRCVKQLPGIMHPCASTVWFDVVMSSETWVGTDGTMRERDVEVSQRFASPADRARWLASGTPVPAPVSIAQGDGLDVGSGQFPSPGLEAIAPDAPPLEGPPAGAGPVDVADGLFTYGQLPALPIGATAALARIDQAWTALRHRYGTMLLRWRSPGAPAATSSGSRRSRTRCRRTTQRRPTPARAGHQSTSKSGSANRPLVSSPRARCRSVRHQLQALTECAPAPRLRLRISRLWFGTAAKGCRSARGCEAPAALSGPRAAVRGGSRSKRSLGPQ